MTARAARSLRTFLLTAVTLVFFAANSWLARLALRAGEIDGGSFTAVRIISGAVALSLFAAVRGSGRVSGAHGSWVAASLLFGYALSFSFAYLWLDAGVGALILFAAVQLTMIGGGMRRGERPRAAEWLGLATALAGLAYLVSPGATAPAAAGAVLMAVAGAAWGGYSLAAKGVRSPVAATARNFLRACPMATAALLMVSIAGGVHASPIGLALAALSGAVTSGLGYALWYTALRELTATRAAIVQLTVPVLAAAGGLTLLGESMTARLALASTIILGGVALAILGRRKTH